MGRTWSSVGIVTEGDTICTIAINHLISVRINYAIFHQQSYVISLKISDHRRATESAWIGPLIVWCLMRHLTDRRLIIPYHTLYIRLLAGEAPRRLWQLFVRYRGPRATQISMIPVKTLLSPIPDMDNSGPKF